MARTMRTVGARRWMSPAGEIVAGECDGRLCLFDWVSRGEHSDARGCNKSAETGSATSRGGHVALVDRLCRRAGAQVSFEAEARVAEEAIRQAEEYFAGRRRVFNIPLALFGTDFQVAVWEALRGIGYGKTRTYADIARAVGRPRGVRAVAAAIGANPVSIFVPCHRVIGADGSLTGYAGGLPAKRLLLDIEKTLTEVPGAEIHRQNELKF